MSGFALHPQTEFPRVRWMMFCLVFFAIPLLMVCFWYNQMWKEKEENRRQKFLQHHESVLSSIAKWDDPAGFFSVLLRGVERRIKKSKDPLRTLRSIAGNMKRHFPGFVECIAFNENGPIEGLADGNPSRTVMKKLFKAVKKANENAPSDAEKFDELMKSFSIFRSFFGSLFKPRHTTLQEVEEVSFNNRHSFVYVSNPFPFGFFLIFFNRNPGWNTLSLQHQVDRHNQEKKDTPLVMVDVSDLSEKRTFPAGFPREQFHLILAEFQANPRDSLCKNGTWWFQKMVTPTIRLVMAAVEKNDPGIQNQRRNVVATVSLIFGVLAFLSWHLMLGRLPFYVSIRLKLVLLFAYAVGLPLAVMTINARDYLIELRYRLENQIHVETETGLTLFDKKFPQVLGDYQRSIKKILNIPIKPNCSLEEDSKQKMKRIISRFNPAEAQLVNEAGELLTKLLRPGEMGKLMGPLKPVYMNLFRNLNSGQNDTEELSEQPATKMAVAAGFDFDAIYADWARSLGQIKEFKFGTKRGIQGIFPILNPAGKAVYLGVLNWSHYTLQKQHLIGVLGKLARSMPDTDIFARYHDPEKPNEVDPIRDVPQDFRFAGMIAGFVKKLLVQGQSLRSKIVSGETTYLLTGVRGDQMSNYYFIAVTNDRQIRRTLDEFRWRLKMISLTIVFIALTVGSLLARKFLEPVSHLASGVNALRRRAFETRIPIMDQDELGDLSGTFNEMMESMADLEVARIVQESLFPMDVVQVGRCGVFGTCKPASQVGGDYFDYFPLANDRVGIIIGDVSGHGVPAAMVMAMAKATMANLGNSIANDPAAVLVALHQLLFKTLNRKKMMSCFFAIIDEPAGILYFSNAGQNNPYLIRGREKIPLTCPGYPLGSRTKAKYENKQMTLQAGDRILFYTDGLIEAEAVDGDVISYQRLETMLPDLFRSDPRASEVCIREWLNALTKPGPQADDITILVVHYG